MASSFPATMNATLGFPVVDRERIPYTEIYDKHCHRIYSLAFWMTDNELLAEELAANTFLRLFALTQSPADEQVDRAFLAEVRELYPVGSLTLQAPEGTSVPRVFGNVKRVELERAVVTIPITERLIFLLHDVEEYGHERIARVLGINQHESKYGLHQARLRIRHLLAQGS